MTGYDEKVRARFDEMDAEGCTTAEIVAELGMTERTVNRWRHDAHRSRSTYVVYPPEMREAARRLLEDGCSKAEAARTIGVSAVTVRAWFPDLPGWTPQQSGEMSAFLRLIARQEVAHAS